MTVVRRERLRLGARVVYTRATPTARPVFHRLPPPTDADIAILLARIQLRVRWLLIRRGRGRTRRGVIRSRRRSRCLPAPLRPRCRGGSRSARAPGSRSATCAPRPMRSRLAGAPPAWKGSVCTRTWRCRRGGDQLVTRLSRRPPLTPRGRTRRRASHGAGPGRGCSSACAGSRPNGPFSAVSSPGGDLHQDDSTPRGHARSPPAGLGVGSRRTSGRSRQTKAIEKRIPSADKTDGMPHASIP